VLRPVEEGLLADPSRTAQPPFWIFRQSAAFFRIVLEFQTKAAPATPPKEAPRGPLESSRYVSITRANPLKQRAAARRAIAASAALRISAAPA